MTSSLIAQVLDPVVLARLEIDANVAELAAELPGITFGYIGNIERWGDDRAWAVFLPHPGRVGGTGDSVALGETADLPKAAANWASIVSAARKRYHFCARN
jgi:hypothetical protein